MHDSRETGSASMNHPQDPIGNASRRTPGQGEIQDRQHPEALLKLESRMKRLAV